MRLSANNVNVDSFIIQRTGSVRVKVNDAEDLGNYYKAWAGNEGIIIKDESGIAFPAMISNLSTVYEGKDFFLSFDFTQIS